MQAMVREGLDLARSMDTTETMQMLDLDSLLDSVCADATDAGQQVELQGAPAWRCWAGRLALRRCLVNLIDNAVKYGQRAQVAVDRSIAGAGAHPHPRRRPRHRRRRAGARVRTVLPGRNLALARHPAAPAWG